MEREAGTDLAQLALLGPFSAGQLLAIAEGILGALERLHRAGVIHGDVKPANLRIGPEQRTVLVDFGVAALPCGGHPGAALNIGPTPMPRWNSATRTLSSGAPGPTSMD